MSALNVWVVDDDESIRWVLEKSLARQGMSVTSFPGAAELFDALAEDAPDVLISDIRMPGIDGLALMQRVHAARPGLPVIIMTAHSDLDAAVASYKGGAFEYLPKPFDVDGVAELVRRAAQKRESVDLPPPPQTAAMIGEAPAMQDVFRAIGRLSQSHITVLITGESGTGKELVARALHMNSPRANRPFIAINTAAIPKDLLESEFFGHERGAFTGAAVQRKGRFEQADGGTLFLDEIGDMPADLQTRLLRVLSTGEFYRVGGVAPIKVDVRVIAATHQDLEQLVRENRFREDLYHRLNVIRIRIPPLRERPEDIPQLARHFLARAAEELRTEPKRLLPEVVQRLERFPWPGNVRQLENLCRWLTVMAPGRDVHPQDLPPEFHDAGSQPAAALPPEEPLRMPVAPLSEPRTGAPAWHEQLRRWADAELAAGRSGLLDAAVPLFERTLIEAALAATRGQRQEAARRLGWGRNTLTRKIKELRMGDEE
ncbi:two-component system, NtrC family, nitrogen regulation response regulator GlnG [Fontimonas thermophila]|uniref:DNA-binding transcriptional regulator NtrC n=1 Tax=Fontimonas thermophila TaxID=1076937 RepID=A0A1I2GWH2_9GAMM|nr:nitrogen regulation protein NR(I) [Fontimonas thermophila]SFF22055.1 two-component system, NtrC family, nitrogen regulation response regulator GlnG [Fontimonas thermophila]